MRRRVHQALASLRWRLTLTFTALLAVLLAALGTYSYFALRSSLIANRVATMQSDVNAAHAALLRIAASPAVPGRRLCASAPALVSRTVGRVIAAATGSSVQVVIYDTALATAAAIPASATAVHLSSDTLQRVETAGTRSSPYVAQAGGASYLVAAFPIRTPGAICGVAQLATAMVPIDNVMHDELLVTGLGGAVLLCVALAAGLLLTGRTLRPLHRLSDTARELAAGDLRARSRLAPRADEVGLLAQSVDDMAERIEASFAAQRESEDQVRRFIADASHELRTPVTALKGYIDVLRRGAARDEGALDAALESMSREAERMRVLVLDLLTLARLDAHRAVQPRAIDLNDHVARLLDEGIPGAPSRVARHFVDGPLVVQADPSALTTIVRNLMANAAQYAAGAAQAWTTSIDGGRARLDVHDHGPGIPAADLPHVFERFYRGEKTRTREEGGSGLGLSIVRGLADAQGGNAAATSGEGRGTTVSVWLPLAPPPTG